MNKDAVWITLCMIVVITINMLGAGVYGECEFIFASVCYILRFAAWRST